MLLFLFLLLLVSIFSQCHTWAWHEYCSLLSQLALNVNAVGDDFAVSTSVSQLLGRDTSVGWQSCSYWFLARLQNILNLILKPVSAEKTVIYSLAVMDGAVMISSSLSRDFLLKC